jgi:hypothetical protein
MELLKVHYTAPRRASYLNFLQSSGESGHSESGLLIQSTYKKTAVICGKKNRHLPRSRNTAVCTGDENRESQTVYSVLKTAHYRGSLAPRFQTVFSINGSQTVYAVFKTARHRGSLAPRFQTVLKHRINGLTTVNRENRPKPRF